MQATLTLKATIDTVGVFANYGVTDRLDVGVAIPITHVALDADVNATILRLSSGDNLLVHTFTQGQNDTENTFSDRGRRRASVTLSSERNTTSSARPATWMSLGVDVRLPTGDADNLLGLGTTQGKFFLIASSNNPRVSPHMNIGFTVSGEGNRETVFQFEPLGVSDEFNYSGGVEIVAHPKLTLLADFLGRTLFDAGVSRARDQDFSFPPWSRFQSSNGASADELDQPGHRSAVRATGIARRKPLAAAGLGGPQIQCGDEPARECEFPVPD